MSTDANPFRTLPPLSRHPVDVGHRTEAAVRDALVRRGYSVLQPLGVNQRYDLVLDDGGRFLRIQCKTGRLRDGAIRFSGVSIRTNTKSHFRRGYLGEVEFFGIFCPDTQQVFLVPIDDVPPSGMGCLRVEPTRNAQVRHIRWADQYALPPLDRP